MDKDGFRKYLQEREIPEEKIEKSVLAVKEFETALKIFDKSSTLESATSEDMHRYSKKLIEEGKNTYDNYVALARYGYFTENNELYVAVMEILDGSAVLDVFYEKLGKEIGDKKQEEIFKIIDRPPLGTLSSEKPIITQTVMERLETLVDPDTCKKILSDVAHGIPKEYYKKEREKYLKSKNIDDYLANRRRNAIAELEEHRDKGTLFFTQEITDEVLNFVKSRPDILTGAREGDKIVHTKIPYMTKEYLTETDETMKRYYYCHCAWAREGIRKGGVQVSPTFCYCSAGFTKQPLEAALDRPLEVEMVKSVLMGDLECKFIVKLPKDVVEKAENQSKKSN